MTRRRDPERIHQAQRAGIFARLTQNDRVDELDAEHWISRWEREAEANGPARGSQGYWDRPGDGSRTTAASIELERPNDHCRGNSDMSVDSSSRRNLAKGGWRRDVVGYIGGVILATGSCHNVGADRAFPY